MTHASAAKETQSTRSGGRRPSSSDRGRASHPLQGLHNALGNRAMQRAIGPISASAPTGIIQRMCDCAGTSSSCDCDKEEAALPPFRRKASENSSTAVPSRATVAAAMSGQNSGRPLDASARAFMEPRFGRDFGDVQIHTDASAGRAARMLQARAFATGRDIYFAPGQYQPETSAGRRLLAHELTHTIQQGGRAGAVSRRPEVVGHPSDPLEHEADLAAERVGDLLASHNAERLAGRGEGADRGIRSSHSNGVIQRDPDAGTPGAPQADVDRIISALQEPQENGVGNYPTACAILDGMWIVVMFQTLEELRKRGFLDLLRGDVCPNMPRVRIAVDAVIAKSSPPVTWQFAKDHPAFADLPEQQKQEVATFLVLPWPMPVDPSAVAGQDGLTSGEIIAAVLIGAAVVGGVVLLLTPGGQAFGAAVLIALAPVGVDTAVVAGAPVVAEIVTGGSFVAETAAATTAFGGSAAAASTAAPALVTTAVTAPTVAGTTVTTVAASSWATAAVATLGTGVMATTLSSDNPSKPNDDPKSKLDSCQAIMRLVPGINARWHIQRPPISGQTTVLAAAFRLDAGVAPPPGQDTDTPQRDWVHEIGMPKDDAGHVIANRFGGTVDFDSPDGNIFPQDLSFNRGTMRSYDKVMAELHEDGSDVCVNIGLIYDSPNPLRPSAALYTYLYRPAGATAFTPPVSALVPNR